MVSPKRNLCLLNFKDQKLFRMPENICGIFENIIRSLYFLKNVILEKERAMPGDPRVGPPRLVLRCFAEMSLKNYILELCNRAFSSKFFSHSEKATCPLLLQENSNWYSVLTRCILSGITFLSKTVCQYRDLRGTCFKNFYLELM